MTLAELAARWLATATQLEPYAPAAAQAFRRCAGDLDAAAHDASEEALSLEEAAKESGFHPDSLGRKIRAGQLTNVGTKRRPRVRRGDLPKKGGRGRPAGDGHQRDEHVRTGDVAAIAREAVAGRIGGK
jgi:hypothetical protein